MKATEQTTRQAGYEVDMGGHQWQQGPRQVVASIGEARDYAESYGQTADWAEVFSVRTGQQVARYQRNIDGDGMTWQQVRF